MTRRDGRKSVPLPVALAALALAAPASGATTIGQTDAGTTNCGEDAASNVQHSTSSASPSYTVPQGPGVITSWQHDAASNTVAQNPMGIDIRLKVFRFVTGPATYLTVGESAVENLTSPGLKTFPTRIPVQGGDQLGFSQLELGRTHCVGDGTGLSGDEVGGNTSNVDPQPNTSITFMLGGTPLRLNVAATVEPDADMDGFGDETQDACPSEGDTQGACIPPETTITRGPKEKSKKKSATFEFTSSEAGSSFQCSLDGKAFGPCNSPHKVKVKKGKHTFEVQAIDAGGTIDASPAGDKWKVKKKKKRK